jgi:phospho-N-acetylmuramoyl-pentapeptide-transferase
MLYWLYRHLDINIFQYISVRAGIAFIVAFFVTLFVIPKFIKWAMNKNAHQPIYTLAPDSHQSKSKTPTMGGVVFLSATLFATLLSAKLNNPYIVFGIFTILSFGFIGVKDDLMKINGKANQAGLSRRSKLILQTIFALFISIGLLFFAAHNTDFHLPFYKHPLFSMELYAIFFWALVIVSSANAVNLTDGLDGLATVPSIFAIFTLSAFAYIGGHAILSSYLLVPKIAGSGEIAIMGAALIGSLIAFLWYNSHPAQLFMGDTGSLTLGAFIAYMAILSKNEILLILVGSIFVIETVSVMLQVGSYKTRKKRIFLMAPIHHHFEQKGWHENKIIIRFWIIALISNLIALITIKVR